RRVVLAAAVSVGLHALALGLVGWRVLAIAAEVDVAVENLPVAMMEEPDAARRGAAERVVLPSLPGDEARVAQGFSAPTAAPNPEARARAAAASSGSGPGVRDPSLVGRRDAETLRAQPRDAYEGY